MLTRCLIIICGLFFLALANASDSVKMAIGDWSFENVVAENLNFDITIGAQGFELTAQADSLQLAAPVGRITDLKLHCNKLSFRVDKLSCESGQISFKQHDLGLQNIVFNLIAMPENDHYQINITGLKLAAAQFNLNANIEGNHWQVSVDSDLVYLPSLISFLSSYLSEQVVHSVAEWSVDGHIKLSADINGQDGHFDNITLKLATSLLNLSDEPGQYVTEDVATLLAFELINKQPTWQWKAEVNIDEGQGYAEPVFIDFSSTPVSFIAEGSWQQDESKLTIKKALFEQESIVQIRGDFVGNIEYINQLNVVVEQTDIALLYQHWLQPFLVGTAIDDIALYGQFSLDYQQQADDYHLSLGVDKVFIDDHGGRFSIDSLSGMIGWSNYHYLVQTDLVWQSGYIYAIPIGQSQIKAQAESSSLVLLEPWQLPILDGELQLNEFSLHRPDGEHLKWTFDGLLTPISMESLSLALEWPLLHGKLSGVIPRVSYADKHIQVDGALLVKLFDGTTIIRDLQLNAPFGALPQLSANVDLTGLDLELLTQTFDFGKITGKLDGTMTNLRLSNWQPVQFDAHFATPDGDRSRRRISQKAVDNLSQIGGGAGGLLSRSFLRFFEDFSYQRLGLSCQLRNEVCEMSGVGETEQGYYIVKGGGLPPRINVVGYTRRVDWPDLIERLKAVSQSSGPVVQ
ncbi:MAG: hypothetical protein COB23_05580 [Methylophaga sp.]|nr:MAG: hypothetical protein COB23_05580 [Methylophaga sp.]